MLRVDLTEALLRRSTFVFIIPLQQSSLVIFFIHQFIYFSILTYIKQFSLTNMRNTIVLGADVGGSHITAALIDLENGNVIPESYFRSTVNAQGDKAAVIKEWSKALQSTLEKGKVTVDKIGIAIPGPFDYENGVSLIQGQDKYDSLYGQNVKLLLAESLGVAASQIRLTNDAACFLSGEVMAGAGKGYGHAIGLTLGTGLGSATYHEYVVKDAGRWCFPFREGIAEDYLSTRWFENRFKARTKRSVSGVKEIAELAATNFVAKDLFEEFGVTLAEFLIPFVQEEKPEVIVLGGNVAHANRLFRPALERTLTESAITIPVHKAQLGETAALIGAAGSWMASIKKR